MRNRALDGYAGLKGMKRAFTVLQLCFNTNLKHALSIIDWTFPCNSKHVGSRLNGRIENRLITLQESLYKTS